MDAKISLREAESGHIEQMIEILLRSLREYQIEIPENYSVSDIESINTKNNSHRAFVLLRDASVIGFLVLRPITRDRIELKRMYLTASERGKGLGAYLLKYAIGFAQTNQYKSVRLETTSKFDKAVSLYNKFGFVVLDDAEKAFGHDLVLEKSIEPSPRPR
jgi:putative acetyltransferase